MTEPAGMRLAKLVGEVRAQKGALAGLRDLQKPHERQEPDLKALHEEVHGMKAFMHGTFIKTLEFIASLIMIMKSPEIIGDALSPQPV